MSAEAPILSRSWKVGPYTATLTVKRPTAGIVSSALVEWSPGVPRDLTESDLAKYREGRHRALLELSTQLGGVVAVLEL